MGDNWNSSVIENMKYKYGKLEGLKFKMEIAIKNLNVLSNHSNLMTNIYQDNKDNHGGRGRRRESTVFEA